ncbi:hypothetical protein DRO64_03735 [Candidatus Bathyarchaeota archaeon]|nr:MAG: hypothetical protein DRO64_03735 [Candidatus Bathyarchaeota archaeon]
MLEVKFSRRLDDLESLMSRIKRRTDEIGTILIYVGVVRGSRGEERVLQLEFEAEEAEMERWMSSVVGDVKAKYGVVDVIVQHKSGIVKVGEDIMHVLVASKRRAEAFKALSEIIDRIKNESPIRKREITISGSYTF